MCVCRDELVIYTGSIIGGLLVDGLGDGVLIDAPHEDLEFVASTSFGLLQVRMCGYSLKQGVRMCGCCPLLVGAYVWV